MDILKAMKLDSKKMVKSVENNIFKIGLYATDSSYDLRSASRLLIKFNKVNVNSFYSLSNFVKYVRGSSKYYECEVCKAIADDIINVINKFLRNYQPLL